MKTKNIYQGLALLAMALTTAACQNELNEDTTQPQPGEKVNMTIRATQGTTPQTRTSYDDKLEVTDINGIVVKWEGGKETGATVEKINVFGYDNNTTTFTTDPEELSSTPASLSADGLSITFTGSVTAANNYLAVYPVTNCTLDKEDGSINFNFLGQTQDCTSGKEMAHLKNYDIMLGSSAAIGTNNFTFEHKATMLRFALTLPKEESVTNVTLASSTTEVIYTKAMVQGQGVQGYSDNEEQEISLGITNHTASTTLKAYMMIPSTDITGAILTITVATASGSIYEGTLNADMELEPGQCYTLAPTLTITKAISLPPVTEGKLADMLNGITLDPSQTELTLTGEVNADDLTALSTFLQDKKSANITTIDLSGLTLPAATVTGFAGCTNVKTVILPTDAGDIGDSAFEGCTALTTIIQNEPASTTRANISSKLKTVGKSAFKDCTSMTEMFLHANLKSIGDNAFQGCTAMKALVFEGAKTVGTEDVNIKLGTDIVADCPQKDLNILLPAITDVAVATTYKEALGKATYYQYNGDYSKATNEDKVKPESYTAIPSGSGVADLTPGGEWGK